MYKELAKTMPFWMDSEAFANFSASSASPIAALASLSCPRSSFSLLMARIMLPSKTSVISQISENLAPLDQAYVTFIRVGLKLRHGQRQAQGRGRGGQSHPSAAVMVKEERETQKRGREREERQRGGWSDELTSERTPPHRARVRTRWRRSRCGQQFPGGS